LYWIGSLNATLIFSLSLGDDSRAFTLLPAFTFFLSDFLEAQAQALTIWLDADDAQPE
jgi:hypothetical protein